MSPRGTPFLSIILPCYNEQEYIAQAVSAISDRMASAGFPYELILVDDGSADATAERARALALRFDGSGTAGDDAGSAAWARMRVLSYAPNRGKGFAVRTGVLESAGRFVVFMDADLSTSPSYIPAFLVEAAAGCDVVAASRHLPASVTSPAQGAARRFAGGVFRSIARRALRLGPETTDVTCGFKMFRGSVARALFARQRLEGWGFDAEILFLAHRAGLVVRELPICWRNRAASRVRILRDAVRTLSDLIQVRRFAASGAYGPADLPLPAPASPSGSGALAPADGGALEADVPAQTAAGVGERDLRDLLGRA